MLVKRVCFGAAEVLCKLAYGLRKFGVRWWLKEARGNLPEPFANPCPYDGPLTLPPYLQLDGESGKERMLPLEPRELG